ncbi:MAG TPA: hypothetical protein G4O02_02365 [Caldilineae bacterium]|nr:hypothetical protein [Caldilineae bacterium]
MTHADYTMWMSLALDDMLTPEERRTLEQHLSRCPSCRALWEEWRQIDLKMRAIPMQAAPPGFAAQVEARLRAHELRRRGIAGGLLALIGSTIIWSALLIASGLAGVWWLAHHPQVLIQCARFLITAITAVSMLIRAAALLWEGLMASPLQPLFLAYVSFLLVLAILWAYVIRWHRPGANSGAGRRLVP